MQTCNGQCTASLVTVRHERPPRHPRPVRQSGNVLAASGEAPGMGHHGSHLRQAPAPAPGLSGRIHVGTDGSRILTS